MINLVARDLPVKVAHKIGDAYDFRHDVAIVYTNSPYVIAILQIIRIMIRFPIFQRYHGIEIMENFDLQVL